jgi:hypothetical protein
MIDQEGDGHGDGQFVGQAVGDGGERRGALHDAKRGLVQRAMAGAVGDGGVQQAPAALDAEQDRAAALPVAPQGDIGIEAPRFEPGHDRAAIGLDLLRGGLASLWRSGRCRCFIILRQGGHGIVGPDEGRPAG